VLDGRVEAEAQQFPTWLTTPGPVVRELLRYRVLALLAIALACLAALIVIRVRRRRAARRDGLAGLAAGAARGRHAVGGPAGFGELRTARPDFSHLAAMRDGGPDLAGGGHGPGTRRPRGRAVDEPGLSGSAPDGPIGGPAPTEQSPAENGVPAGGTPPGTLRAWGLELGDGGIRAAAPAGPPWAPAEKPPGKPPWEPADPPRAEDGDGAPPGPGELTDTPPIWPDGGR
jgi:hypothetical protein